MADNSTQVTQDCRHSLLKMFWGTGNSEGSLLKQKLPMGVMNVVNRRDDLASGIFQSPLLASNFVKTLAHESCASVSLTLGSGCTARTTLLLSGLRSTHIRTLPDFLGTMTIPAHQGVGSSTLEITPMASMLASSSATFEHSGRANVVRCPQRKWFGVWFQFDFQVNTHTALLFFLFF